MPTQQQVAMAALAALNASLASYGPVSGAVKAVDLDDNEARSNDEHVQVTVTRRFSNGERAGRESQSPWRITTRPVANYVSNARELETRCATGLSGVRLTAGGQTSTPVRLESSDAIGEDDGKYSGLTTWTVVF
jgi:hypothetical protein